MDTNCSLCIRKYLHHKTQCPICFEEIFEKDLRKNKLVDEIIIQYLNFKEKRDKKVYHEKLITVKNENSEVECSTNNFEYKEEQDMLNVSHHHLDNSMLIAGNTTPRRQKNNQQDMSTPSTSADSRIPSMFTPKSRKSFQKEENHQLVSCPVCKVEVPQNNINKHLDDCLRRENTKMEPKKSEPKRKPLPKLVYSLMKDNVIRKRLKELGLSSQGDRKALTNRLQKYTVLYNAECDKTYPRPIPELIKQCEEEEDLEKKIQKSNSIFSNVTRNTEDNIVEQKRKQYLTTNKESFDKLIVKLKHDNDPQKISVRRILNEENSDILLNDCVAENNSTLKNDQTSDFLLLNSTNCIEDSNSNTSYLLQSSKCPMDFLTVELDTSSDDSANQCAFNHDISNRSNTINPDLFNRTIKMENKKPEELSSENILIHEEIISNNHSRQCDVLKNEIDIDTIKSISELVNMETKNEEQTRLANRNRSATKYTPNKHVAHSELRDRWQKELRNENVDSIIEDDNNIDVKDNYEKSNLEQLNEAVEKYAIGMKSEKENMKALDKDLTTWTPRKREREMAFALSDEEKIADRTMNVKKSLRFGLSEAKGFNNENFDKTARDEEKSQNEKEESQVILSFQRFSQEQVTISGHSSGISGWHLRIFFDGSLL
ncbi:E3 ubiquitin-protein ligase RAD18 [Atta colombica]|uniref:RING-type E3 ubiquitin transferase n=1 Tax=Atta colombica TaxID=520822 RepID=A0A195B1K0_9HYME|nr:E3 ubiquitin-protein ligase RAD18 [Atta colombica]